MVRYIFIGVMVLCSFVAGAKEGINSDGVIKGQAVTKGRFFKKAVEAVKISGKNTGLSGRKAFIAPMFRITYLVDSSYNNSVGGVTTSKSKVISTLEGVSDADFKVITESIYQEFLAACRAEGYEIADHSGNSGFQKYKMKKTYPYNKKGKVITIGEGTVNQEGFTSPLMKMLMADREAVAISVDLTVGFVINNRNQKKFTFGNKAAVETSQGISVTGKMMINGGKAGVTVQLGQPVYSDLAFGKVANATTKGDKAGDVIHGVGQWLGGGGLGNRKKTTRAEVQADPVRYAAAAKDALGTVNATFVDALKQSTK